MLRSTSDPVKVISLCVEAYWQHIDRYPLERLLIFELTHFALRQPGWDPQRAPSTAPTSTTSPRS